MMGRTTGIEWASSTFNSWIGCAKVSRGCAHCYAERESTRFGMGELWGPQAGRRRTSEAYWRQPLAWARRARENGGAWRVFCGSFCDVFEGRVDLGGPRADLWELIGATPELTD